MTDIVARLRASSKNWVPEDSPGAKLEAEACDEIERLRAALEVLHNVAMAGPVDPACGAMIHARALIGN